MQNRKLLLTLIALIVTVCAVCAFVSCTAEPKIDHIEIYSSPKTSYVLGEELDLTDASILVVYVDQSERKVSVTPDMVSSYSPDTLGEQYILISYEGVTVTFKVTVMRPQVASVNLIVPDENVNYIVEQQLNLEDCYLVIGFSDGTALTVPVTREMCSGYDRNTLGLQEVKVTYNLDGTDYSATYNVTVEDRELVGIDMHTVPNQTVYYLGDSELDLTGGIITLKYNNGYTHTMSMTSADGTLLEGLTYEFDSTQVASSVFAKVMYGGFETEFNVKIANRDVASYKILNYAEQNEAHPKYQYLDLDLDGLEIAVTYTNGSSEEITIPSDKVSFSGYDRTLAGKQTVNINFYYGDVCLATVGELEIDVIPREATGLKVIEEGKVYQDTEYNLQDWQIALVYNNGEVGESFDLISAYVDWKGGMVIDRYEEAGEQTWVIVYNDLTLEYDFEVIALAITDIELNNQEGVIAYLNGTADTSDITINVTYNSGAVKENLPIGDATVEFDNTAVGSVSAKLTYVDEYDLSFTVENAFTVTVVRKIKEVKLGGDVKIQYTIGEELNLENLILAVTYEGEVNAQYIDAGSDNFGKDWTISVGYDTDEPQDKDLSTQFTEVGTYRVYFETNGLEQECFITVEVTNEFEEIKELCKENEDGGYDSENVDFGVVTEGTDIDLTGYALLISRAGGDEYVEVTKDMLDYNSRNTSIGERIVTIEYNGATLQSKVIVVAKEAVSIEIKQEPTQKTYVSKGSGLTFNYDGMILWLIYNNDTYEEIVIEDAVADNTLQFVGLDSEIGEQTIQVKYNYSDEKTLDAEVKVTVVSSSVSEVSWNSGSDPTAEVSAGTRFDITSFAVKDKDNRLVRLGTLQINVKETNGNMRNAALSEYADGFIVSDYSPNSSGLQYVKLFYGTAEEKATLSEAERNARTLTVVVTVGDRKLDSVSLEANIDDAFVVIQGAPIAVSDYMLRLTFTDGTSTLIPLKSEYINVSDGNPGGYDIADLSTSDARPVTISYTYGTETAPVTATVDFRVVEKSLVKIDVNDLPKRYYIEHEEFDVSGGTIMLYYDNGTTETKRMSDAAINDASSTFNINSLKFNNEEFDGQTKAQHIEITYSYYGQKYTTSYVIYMRDRKDVSIKYSDQNDYDFVYGSVEAPSVTINGYSSYEATERTVTFGESDFTIEYIPQNIWLSVRREAGADYTTLPSDAGEYRIVVSYAGDGIHNAFEDATNILKIAKKKIYVGFAKSQSKVYGQDMPKLKMTFGNSSKEALAEPLSVFVEGDGLYSESFNTEYNKKYATTAILVDADGKEYLSEGALIVLDMFDIVCTDASGNEVYLSNDTPQGIYSLNVNNSIVGKNYEIVFERGTFNISKRPVVITPESLTYTYGQSSVSAIPFTVSAVDGEAESGLYGTDVIKGNLARENREQNSVGEYAIEVGSLITYNPNYDIRFTNEAGAKVTITKRTIYVKTDTLIKVYGEEAVVPEVRFYGNSECTDETNAFAPGDDLASLGVLTYKSLPDRYKEAGMHAVDVSIDGTGDKAENYDIVYIGGYIEVAKRPIVVTANPASKIYGSADPVLTYTVSGIEGNSASGLIVKDGVKDTLTGALGRETGENKGDYNIQIGTLGSDNYYITFISDKLTVESKSLYIKVDESALTKVYDGKKPEISEYTIYEIVDGENVDYADAGTVSKFITFSFEGMSKDAGTYPVKVKISNNNYSVAFIGDADYTYVISKRKVSITIDNYVGLPDGLEYCCSDYVFSAHISTDDLQHVYNDDGTYATDEDNRPLFDDDTVSLSRSVVRNAGTYTTRVTDITDKNYELDSENSPEITFTVKPRTVYIVIKCNSTTDENTIEREFNNQSATLTSQDYEIENTIAGESTPYFALGIYSGETAVTAKDVRYAEDGVTVVGYEIKVAENSLSSNYVVALKEAYRFKIVPRSVEIRINDRYLSKVYDGEEPSITSNMFSPAVATTGFDNSTVSFTFDRNGNDDNDNAAVGTYDVVISCSDRNFAVTTLQNYVYTIERSTINVTISSAALSKAYDGEDFSIEYAKLTMSSYYGTAPIVHNFAFGSKDAGYEFDTFKSKLENLTSEYKTLKNAIEAVSFGSGANNARNKLVEALQTLVMFGNDVGNSNLNCFTEENTTNILLAISAMQESINSAIDAIDEGELGKAETRFKNVTDKFKVVKNIVTQENSYIAFVFGAEGDNTTSQKGEYAISMYYADYNRDYKLLNSSPTAEVKEHKLKIIVDSLTVPYGTAKDGVEVPYTIWDSSNGIDVTDDKLIKSLIQGKPVIVADIDILKAGTYGVDLSGMSISNVNYSLDIGTSAKVTVGKATLTIVMNDIADESKFVYNGKISQSDIQAYVSQYTYFDVNSISEYTNDPKELEYIRMAEEYATANGLGGLSVREKLQACFGGLAGGDSVNDLKDILKGGASLRCHCYIDENGTVEIFNVDGFPAGDYDWTVNGYTADNYYIKVLPGTLTVAKAKLYAMTGVSGILNKTYGDQSISFYYGSVDTRNILVYADDDTDKANGISLSDVVWAHTSLSEIDPMDAYTNAGDDSYNVSFSSNGYYMENYEIVFDDSYEVQVVRATLTLTMKSTVAGAGNVITAKYMATPANYIYSYEGFKNDDTAESLGLRIGDENAPVISFMDNGSYFGVGLHTMYGDSVDISKATANVQNYEIVVQDFSYKVEARKIYVWLEDVDKVLTPLTGGKIEVAPYVISITETKSVTVGEETIYVPTRGNIVSGNYGKSNFRFEAEMTDEEKLDTALSSALNAYVQSALSKIAFLSKTVIESGKEGKNIEYYKGSELYAHSITKVGYTQDDVNGDYVTMKLGGMSFATKEYNVVLDYKEFKVDIQREVRSVIAEWTEKLLAEDLSNMEEVKKKLNVAVGMYMMVNGSLESGFIVDGSNGSIVIEGLDSCAVGKTNYITVKYDYQCKLFDLMSNLNYEVSYATTIGSQTQEVRVDDARQNTYDTTKVDGLSSYIPTRFYANKTSTVSDPEISGLTYGKLNNATGDSTFVSTKNAYDFDGIRMRVRLAETEGENKFTVVFAGDVSSNGYALAMTFNRSDVSNAVVTLYSVSGGKLTAMSTANYAMDCSKLFDGYSHDLRIKFNKELITVIASIDGSSGAIKDISAIDGITSARAYLTGADSDARKFYISSTMKYALGSLTLTEQGLYEHTGTFIDIAQNANGVISVDTSEAFFKTNASLLNNFFGLPSKLGSAFTTEYYVDGEKAEEPANVILGRGSHMIELALYYNGALLDTDYTIVTVTRSVTSLAFDVSGGTGEIVTAGSKLRMYTPLVNSSFDGDSDLVTSDAATARSYMLYATDTESSTGNGMYAPSYYSHSFTLDRIASYAQLTGNAIYEAGTNVLYYNLFAEGGYSTNNINGLKTATSDYALSIATNPNVKGARLRFERHQNSQEVYDKTETYDYYYDVYLDVRCIEKDATEVTTVTTQLYSNVKGSALGVGFEVRAYYDKLGAMGNGSAKIRIRQIGTTTWQDVDLASIGDIGDAQPFVMLTGNATRVTNNKLLFVENDHAYNDYLIDDEYTMYNGSAVTLKAGSTLKLADGVGTARYSAYNNIEFEFGVESANGTVGMALAESAVYDEYNPNLFYGAYLDYDLEANKLVFKFRYGSVYSLAQEFKLSESNSAVGTHKITVDLNMDEMNLKNYVGGDSELGTNLVRNGVTLTDSKGAKLYYHKIDVTIDGESAVFYLPHYADMNGWYMANGSVYGSGDANKYSDIDINDAPATFISIYNYNSVTAPEATSLTVYKYVTAIADSGAYTQRALKNKTPLI